MSKWGTIVEKGLLSKIKIFSLSTSLFTIVISSIEKKIGRFHKRFVAFEWKINILQISSYKKLKYKTLKNFILNYRLCFKIVFWQNNIFKLDDNWINNAAVLTFHICLEVIFSILLIFIVVNLLFYNNLLIFHFVFSFHLFLLLTPIVTSIFFKLLQQWYGSEEYLQKVQWIICLHELSILIDFIQSHIFSWLQFRSFCLVW